MDKPKFKIFDTLTLVIGITFTLFSFFTNIQGKNKIILILILIFITILTSLIRSIFLYINEANEYFLSYQHLEQQIELKNNELQSKNLEIQQISEKHIAITLLHDQKDKKLTIVEQFLNTSTYYLITIAELAGTSRNTEEQNRYRYLVELLSNTKLKMKGIDINDE